MQYKKDSVYYIKNLCEKSGCRYDIETGTYIPKELDEAELISYGLNSGLRCLAKILASNVDRDKLREILKKHKKNMTNYETKAHE